MKAKALATAILGKQLGHCSRELGLCACNVNKFYQHVATIEKALREAHAEGHKLGQAEGMEEAARICDKERERYNFTTGAKAGLALQADLLGQEIRSRAAELRKEGA